MNHSSIIQEILVDKNAEQMTSLDSHDSKEATTKSANDSKKATTKSVNY
jgi:hypothetical protein